MITLLASAPALPLGKSGKFVAAAYIVVFVIILIYVAIMAVRAQRAERDLEQLRRDVEAARTDRTTPGDTGVASEGSTSAADPERSGSHL